MTASKYSILIIFLTCYWTGWDHEISEAAGILQFLSWSQVGSPDQTGTGPFFGDEAGSGITRTWKWYHRIHGSEQERGNSQSCPRTCWVGRKSWGGLIRYEEVLLYVIRLQSQVLVLSIDRATSFERIAQIAKSILSELQLQWGRVTKSEDSEWQSSYHPCQSVHGSLGKEWLPNWSEEYQKSASRIDFDNILFESANEPSPYF